MSKANKDSHLIESIAVKEFFEIYGKQLKLRLVTGQKTLSMSMIREKSINRPALAVTGYFKYFANKRLNITFFSIFTLFLFIIIYLLY